MEGRRRSSASPCPCAGPSPCPCADAAGVDVGMCIRCDPGAGLLRRATRR